MSSVIYAGTARGVIAIKERDGEWSVNQRRFLPQWEVTQFGLNRAGQLVASTRGDGVWLQVDQSGEGRTGGWAKPCYGLPGPGKVHAIAVDPDDPETIYAGTEPIGLWVTHDGGKTWEPAPGLRSMPEVAEMDYPVPSVEPHVRDVTIDPTNPDIMYAALQVGWLAKSTDRGKTWKLLTDGVDADVHTIVVRPDDPKRIYVATGGHSHRLGEAAGLALYASKNGGETWHPMATEFPQDYSVPLAMHPTNPDILFSGVANGPPPEWWRRDSAAEAKMIVSRDGGRSWQEVENAPADIGKEYPGAFAFDADNPDDIYMSTDKGSLFVSHDLGVTWDRIPVDIGKMGGLAEVGLNDMQIFHN